PRQPAGQPGRPRGVAAAGAGGPGPPLPDRPGRPGLALPGATADGGGRRAADGERGGGPGAGRAGPGPAPGAARPLVRGGRAMTRPAGSISARNSGGAVALGALIDDLAGRMQAGESVDVEAVLAGHPDQADELRQLLPALQLLADVASAGGAGRAMG